MRFLGHYPRTMREKQPVGTFPVRLVTAATFVREPKPPYTPREFGACYFAAAIGPDGDCYWGLVREVWCQPWWCDDIDYGVI